MSVLLIVGPKCTMAASHALVTDRETDGRHTVTLCFPLDAASVMTARLPHPKNNSSNFNTCRFHRIIFNHKLCTSCTAISYQKNAVSI